MNDLNPFGFARYQGIQAERKHVLRYLLDRVANTDDHDEATLCLIMRDDIAGERHWHE